MPGSVEAVSETDRPRSCSDPSPASQGSSSGSSAYQKGSAPCQWSEQIITQSLGEPGSLQAGVQALLLSVYKPRVTYLQKGAAMPGGGLGGRHFSSLLVPDVEKGAESKWDWARLPRRCSFPKLPPFLPVGHPHRLRFALLPLAPGAEMFRVLLSPASSQS